MDSNGDVKRARIIAEQAARDDARTATEPAPARRKPRTNWAASQPVRPPGRRGAPPFAGRSRP